MPQLNPWSAKAQSKRVEQRVTYATPAEIERVRELYGNTEVEFDADAQCSIADNGVWVQGWAWLHKEDLPTSSPDKESREREGRIPL